MVERIYVNRGRPELLCDARVGLELNRVSTQIVRIAAAIIMVLLRLDLRRNILVEFPPAATFSI